MENSKKLSRAEMKQVLGGDEVAFSTNCSNSCGASITNCNGTCTCTETTCTCKGAHNTLTKSCATAIDADPASVSVS